MRCMLDTLEGCDTTTLDQILQQIGQTMEGMKQMVENMGC